MASNSKALAGKPPPTEELGFWSIFVDVSGDWGCVAGKKRSDLQDRTKYKTKPGPPFSLLFDINAKIERAVLDKKKVITVSVEPDPTGGKFIIEDEPAPQSTIGALGTKTSSKRTHGRAKKPHTVKRAKATDDKAKPGTAKPGKAKDDK